MGDLIGVVINNYEIQEQVGGGGMGVVYRAHHPILKRDIAIKVMRPELAAREGFYKRFVQEAQTVACLEHPGIVRVRNFGQHKETEITYLTMDFVRGPSLRTLLRDSPFGLPLEDALLLTEKIANALYYAHNQGVLHLDLKPDNILLAPSYLAEDTPTGECPYRPIISDFGLARLRVAPGISIYTSQRIGTPHYMSPEQCRGESLDEKSDIYSLGVMFYEILTGQRPFPISTLAHAVQYHGSHDPKAPSTHVPDLPPSLDAFVLRMLAKQPERRPTSCQEVAQHLAEILAPPEPGRHFAGDIYAALQQRLAQVPTAVGRAAVVTPAKAGGEEWATRRHQIRAYIQVTHKGKQVDRFPITSEPILAGRMPPSDLLLNSADRQVSKRHCAIRWRDGEMMVRDLHSTNKTFLNKQVLEPGIFTSWPSETLLHVGLFTLRWSLSQTGPLTSPPPLPADLQASYASAAIPTIQCPDGRPEVLEIGPKLAYIGRLPGCDMVIAHRVISKQHCTVHWDGTQVVIEDLKSTNGTFLGETRLKANRPYPWPPDVAVQVGPFSIRLK